MRTRCSQDPLWLARGRMFAAFAVSSDAGRADWRSPDHPASLFEGAACALLLLAELQAVMRDAAAAGAADAASGGGEAAHQHQHAARLARSGMLAFPLFELWGQ